MKALLAKLLSMFNAPEQLKPVEPIIVPKKPVKRVVKKVVKKTTTRKSVAKTPTVKTTKVKK